MKVTGDFINYSITILDGASQKDEAINFLDFMLSTEGMNIFRMYGQEPLVPMMAEPSVRLPAKLLKYFGQTK